MKQIVKNIFISIAVIFICSTSGCNSSITNNPTLVSAEQLMNENPDSAFAILRSIDTLTLTNPEDKALYYLLIVQAEDKNYIDNIDDSKIRIAVDYYNNSDDKYHKMLSYYYLARIQFNNKEYSNSITSLLHAEDGALDLEDDFYLGLIYRQFGDIYSMIYNGIESLNYSQKSYEHFKKSGKEDYCDWALWDIARAHYNCKDYESSIRTSNELIELGHLRNNEILIADGLKLLGMSYYASGQFNRSIAAYSQVVADYPSYMTAEDYSNLGSSYNRVGNIDSARYYMNIVSKTDSTLRWLPYTVSKSLGDYKSAVEALEHEYEYQDQIIKAIVSQNVTETVSNYREYERIIQERDIQHEKTTKKIIIVVLIAIIILVSIIAHLRIKTQKKEAENNMLLASNLRNILQTKEAEVVTLRSDYDKQIEYKKVEAEGLQNAINNLFEQRFATIDKLSSAYYEYQGTANERQKIYAEVMSIVSGLGSDKKIIRELECFINTYKDNLLVHFKREFPDIKESDYVLYLYVVAGFSSRAISIFIGEKLEVVYNRKSRLKQKINRSDSPYKEIFSTPLC